MNSQSFSSAAAPRRESVHLSAFTETPRHVFHDGVAVAIPDKQDREGCEHTVQEACGPSVIEVGPAKVLVSNNQAAIFLIDPTVYVGARGR